ncbi:O133 family O-antigen flippase [Escherichia marmotae]|uniref:O133 family O-antigen flippase n=1 Tax=Escherichia marmotae TaxID=1499973 RepID=UPI0015E54F76|nr:O133 family O-antigen flippase [Escherichia marmotae]MBA7739759.1 O133 family O-antigen flippase [Escherichia marmotae]MBA7953892.1 O133 family O-antigen flippase [Escherichia marmotae]QLP29445.1 O133 family O-antigen flippase [Escherichia marmotae]
MNKILKDIPIKSILHLFIVRGSIYLFPFITLPIITRNLGVAHFGILSLFLAAQQYLVMLVEYGFTLTGARDIVRCDNKQDEIKIINEIILCRLLMFLFCTAIIIGAYAFFIEYGYISCYLILWSTVFCSVFNQTHFFIGKEKTGFIVISTCITRIVSIVIVVLYVKDNRDINIALLAYSINTALPNVLSTFYLNLYLKYKVKIIICNNEIIDRFKSGYDIFISNVFTSIYSTLTLMYLGTAKGAIETGYYSSADKLKSAAQGILFPVAQAFFPRVSKEHGISFYLLWRKSTTILVCFAVAIVASLFIFSNLIYTLLLGEQYLSGIYIYYILTLAIIPISFGISYAQNLYLTQGQTKLLRKIYFAVSVLHLFHMPILVHFFGAIGAAISVLITESFASLLMFIFRKKCYTWNQA